MRAVLLDRSSKVWCASVPTRPGSGSGLRSGGGQPPEGGIRYALVGGRSALALLVAQVLADDHDPTVATDDLALVADRLDARLDLHGRVFLTCGEGSRQIT